MIVKAKFQCNGVIPQSSGVTVNFHAVYGEGKENKEWAKSTPSGSLQMVINPELPAAEFFKQGQEYYLTFELAI